jgi:hypothetical protein
MARRLRKETTLTINWHDAVKWCDALPQHEWRTACHHTDTNLAVIHRTGQLFGRRHAWGAAGVGDFTRRRMPAREPRAKCKRGPTGGLRIRGRKVEKISG